MSRYAKPDKIKIPTSLVVTIEMWRQDQEISISEFARRAGIDHGHMSRILSGQVDITAETALKLEQVTGYTALRLMMIQVKHRLAQARRTRAIYAQAGNGAP